MTSKSWSAKSAAACAISLIVCGLAAAQTSKPLAIALTDAADASQWQSWCKDAGCRVIATSAGSNADQRVLALGAAVEQSIRSGEIDPARVYLAGRGPAAAAVFYTISRLPDLWAGAIAIEGSPQPAIDSDRIFAANFANVPVLWASSGDGDEALASQLKSAGLNVEWRSAKGLTNAAVFQWLAGHKREEFPTQIDCETNSPQFARCYWIQMTRFDPNERNDVLPSSHIRANIPPSLDLGAFVYKADDPGPGLLVTSLPEKYDGPLKTGDRLMALEGRPIANARQFSEMMAKYTEEKQVVVTVQRGKERNRVETRVVVPRRDPLVTARVQAQYAPAEKEIQIVSRTVKEMRVTIPPHWAQDGKLFWNGLALEKIESPGCFLLTVDKELLHAAPCQ